MYKWSTLMTVPRQLWRDELIDPYARLREIRALLRRLCELSPPDGEDIVRSRHELHAIFRVCQLAYGQGRGVDHIPFSIMRMMWFRADGHLPDYVLRGYEIMQERGISDAQRRIYRLAVELPFTDEAVDPFNESFAERLGRIVASVSHRIGL